MYLCVNVYIYEQLYEACSERLYYVSRLMCEYRRLFNAYALELHVNAVKLDYLAKRVENMATTLNDN